MEAMQNWLVNSWNEFCLWVNNQPTFVEIAFGIGLFYLALQITKQAWKLLAFIVSGLLSTPARFKKQKDMRPAPRRKRPVTMDDDAPPFVFR